MDIFGQVAALFTARQTRKASDFDALVKAVADGNPPPPATIAELLEAAGKTPDDLQREVTRRQQRAEFARRLAELPAMQEEAAELKRKGSAEMQRFQALITPLQQEHQRTIDGLNGRFFFLAARIPEAESMADKLRQTYEGPLTAELDDLRMKQGELGRAIRKALQTAERHEHDASFTKPAEPDYIQTVRSEGKFLGVVAESTTWTKITHAEPVRILSAEDQSTEMAAAKACRQSAAELQRELDLLTQREQEILRLMLEP
jgi:hypothetical protein